MKNYTTKEIAAELNCDPFTITRLAKENDLGYQEWKYKYYNDEEKEILRDIITGKKEKRKNLIREFIKQNQGVTENEIVCYMLKYISSTDRIQCLIADISFEDGDLAENPKNNKLYYLTDCD